MPEKYEEAADGEDAQKQNKKTNEVTSAPAYKNVRLTLDEENMVYLELSEYLLNKYLCSLSSRCLTYISQQEQVRVLFCKTKSKMLLH